MNKEKAIQNAKDFIKTYFNNKTNLNLNKPFDAFFSDEVLEDDPNLEVLKFELNKISYSITQTSKNWFSISKIK